MNVNDFADESEEYDDYAITLGDLRAGESVSLKITDEPEMFESDNYENGVRFPGIFVASDYSFVHTSDDGDDHEIQGGDDITLLTWSKRLVRAAKEYAGGDVRDIEGEEITIEKSGSGFDVDYSVSEAADN